jgi:hypothetical protein
MPIDLSKVNVSSAAHAIINPRDVFAALPNKDARYQYPRDVQAQVWTSWFARRAERDVVLKMNTGAGKTVVGLVILRSCLAEKSGPAVYVAPDKYLVRQVIAEAEALGIEYTTDPRSARFQGGHAVLVINAHKLINGRSVFGTKDEGRKIPIGSVIVDDVHACLATAESQFSIVVEAPSPLYKSLFGLFREALSHQSATTVLDVEAHEPGKVMLVPYWAWASNQPEVASLLHAERDSDELMFSWPLIRDTLQYCQCTVGGGRVEITTRCLPIDNIPSFAEAQRRVFMSATLADDSVLVTHFDVAPHAASTPIVPTSSADVGDRLILVPQELDTSISDDDLKAFAGRMSASVNVVVLVPSGTRAQYWEDVADATLTADSIAEGVARLKAGHVGLVVLVNKYDGVDLPGDACRLLVLDGVPEVRRGIDRLEEALLRGTPEQLSRAVQRIEQGMGRGVRSSEDRCAVLLMGRSLTRYLYIAGALNLFTPATRAQFELSQQISQQLRDGGLEPIQDAVGLVISRDEEWIALSRNTLVQVPYKSEGVVSAVAQHQRAAFNHLAVRRYQAAASELQTAVNNATLPLVRGWLKQQLAEVVNFVDPVESQVILAAAQQDNRLVLKPLEGISYVRLEAGLADQAAAVANGATDNYVDRNKLLVDLYAQLENVKFYPGTADEFEAAIAWMGSFLGFGSQRPEKEFGHGPDNLWSMGGLRYCAIECKNGVTSGTISKHDANQMAGSMNWFTSHYDATCTVSPLLIHPTTTLHNAANATPGLRVMDVECLADLKAALRRFALTLASLQGPYDVSAIGSALRQNGLSADTLLTTFSKPPRRA